MNEETSTEVEEETVDESTPDTTEQEPSNEQEEPQDEQPLYAGKYKTPEELEKAYAEANAANTRMAQQLSVKKTPELPEDKKQILDEIRNLGFVTKEEVAQSNAVAAQQAKDEADIARLGVNPNQATMLKRYASHPDNVHRSMEDLWSEIGGNTGGTVVKKTVIKPRNGSKQPSFKILSKPELVALSKADYNKYWQDLAKYEAGNNS